MIFPLIVLSLAASPARAQELPVASALPALIAIARQRNPEVLAARKSWEMAEAKVGADKAWPAPEVGVEYWGFSRSGLNPGSAGEKWYDVSQTIPFPGKLALRGKSSAHLARREGEAYRAMEQDVVAKVKQAYYGLLFAQREAKVYEATVEVLRRFARIAESKYAVGKAAQPSVLKAQVELSKVSNRAITSRRELETAQARLNALLARAPGEPILAAAEPEEAASEPAQEALEALALERRPEVHGAAHHVEHMRAELSAKRADYLPDFMVQYTWRTRVGMPSDAVGVVKMTLPFLWFRGQRAIVKSTRLELEHADAMLESARIAARFEVKDGLVQVQAARREVELYKTTILPQTEQSLTVSEAGYRADRIGFLDLLDAERTHLDAQLEYYKAVSEYGSRLAMLERVVGADLTAGRNTEDHEHLH